MRCNKQNLSRLTKEGLLKLCTYIEMPKGCKKDINQFMKCQKKKKVDYFLHICPYCNISSLCGVYHLGKRKNEDIRFCSFCGESDPLYKMNSCIRKINIILNLINDIETNKHLQKDFDEKIRILLEQCIVIMATGLEILFRNIYSILMNVRYVKNGENLYSKFYGDTKNHFSNIDNALKKINKI